MSNQSDQHHTLFDDAQGLAFGTVMAAFGMVILTSLGFVTGQMAGLAVLISYVSGWSFGAVFFLINIPFYWIGYKRMGLRFMVKTFIAVTVMSILSYLIRDWVSFDSFNPLFGAVIYGCISGSALLALFRHGASLGGIGILAVYLQERTRLRAGQIQMAFDAVLFAIALMILPLPIVLYSFVGAVVLNFVIAVNHRRDRYVGF
ncbi:YitT family protein [Ketogulonicigenium robustum]|nr:YitT family protein [Ketogulonicigenium robustum]